jgi:hypothetical protein
MRFLTLVASFVVHSLSRDVLKVRRAIWVRRVHRGLRARKAPRETRAIPGEMRSLRRHQRRNSCAENPPAGTAGFDCADKTQGTTPLGPRLLV